MTKPVQCELPLESFATPARLGAIAEEQVLEALREVTGYPSPSRALLSLLREGAGPSLNSDIRDGQLLRLRDSLVRTRRMTMQPSGRLLADNDQSLVWLNAGDPPMRQAFTIVHELAHLSVLRAVRQCGGDEEFVAEWAHTPTVERLCDEVALEVLTPRGRFDAARQAFERRGESGVRLIARLASKFSVSFTLAARRAIEVGAPYVAFGTRWQASARHSECLRITWRACPKEPKVFVAGGKGLRDQATPVSEAFTSRRYAKGVVHVEAWGLPRAAHMVEAIPCPGGAIGLIHLTAEKAISLQCKGVLRLSKAGAVSANARPRKAVQVVSTTRLKAGVLAVSSCAPRVSNHAQGCAKPDGVISP